MQFNQIQGHKAEIEVLKSLVDENKIPHAMLFHGPRGVGKHLTARAFVQYLNCKYRKNGDSCGKCPSCLQISKFNHPDIHYIFPIVKRNNPTRNISADYLPEWREMLEKYPYMPEEKWLELIEAGNSQPLIYVTEAANILNVANLSNYSAPFKTFIVWLPERMNLDTANKLLKIIEEPFNDTLFIFISNDPGSILPTIKSRLRGLEFLPVPEKEMKVWFEKQGYSEEADALAKIAGGNMNRARELIETDGELTEFSGLFIELMRACYARNITAMRDFSEKFAAFGREKSIRFLSYLSRMVRESFISNLKSDALVAMTGQERAFTEKFGPFINAANVEEMSREIDKAKTDIGRNANQKIVWFDLLLYFMQLLRKKL